MLDSVIALDSPRKQGMRSKVMYFILVHFACCNNEVVLAGRLLDLYHIKFGRKGIKFNLPVGILNT